MGALACGCLRGGGHDRHGCGPSGGQPGCLVVLMLGSGASRGHSRYGGRDMIRGLRLIGSAAGGSTPLAWVGFIAVAAGAVLLRAVCLLSGADGRRDGDIMKHTTNH